MQYSLLSQLFEGPKWTCLDTSIRAFHIDYKGPSEIPARSGCVCKETGPGQLCKSTAPKINQTQTAGAGVVVGRGGGRSSLLGTGA